VIRVLTLGPKVNDLSDEVGGVNFVGIDLDNWQSLE